MKKKASMSTKVKKVKEQEPSVVDKAGVELERPVWMDEKDWKQMSEDQKEFGTVSSQNARQDKKDHSKQMQSWEHGSNKYPDPPKRLAAGTIERESKRERPDLSGLSKRELENLGHQFGIEIDRRLRKETIRRIVESTISIYNREKRLIRHMSMVNRREAVGKTIAIAMAIGIACLAAYAFMMTGGW